MLSWIDFMRKITAKLVFGTALVFYLSLMSVSLKAAQWSLSPALGVAQEYGNNAALSSGVKESYWQLLAVPSLNMVRKDRNTELSLHTYLDFKYSKDDELSNQGQRMYLRYIYRAQRHKVGVKGTLKRENVLRSTSAEIDPDDIEGSDLEDADTSVLQESSKRTIVDMRPYWSWKVSERDTLKFQYRFLDTGYSTDLFSDQRKHTLSANLSHRVTQKLDAILNLSGSQFNNQDDKSRVDNRQVNLGANYKFSDRFTGNAQVGFRNSSAKSVDSSGVIYQVTANKKTEVGSWNVLARRDVRSSAQHTTTLADEFKVWWRNKLRPTVDVSLYFNAYQNKSLADNSSSEGYFGIQPRIFWRLSFEWVVNFSYEFRQLKDNEDLVAKSDSVAVGVSYAWPTASVSR